MENRFLFRCWSTKKGKFIDMSICSIDSINGLMPLCREKNEDFILMQSTGLKDRNGKLIYEGDIIKYTDCEGKKTIGSLEIDRFNLLTFTNMENCDFCEEWSDVVKAVFFTGNSTIEVIGNIYENKELLNGNKNEV